MISPSDFIKASKVFTPLEFFSAWTPAASKQQLPLWQLEGPCLLLQLSINGNYDERTREY
jgi:EAL domain-containing protein (putative c-di-GMP-specific phosphodiesterase class I)